MGAHTVRLLTAGARVRGAPHPCRDRRPPRASSRRFPGIEHAISSNEIFDLPEFPQRLLIVGGGYIAVEFASVFARLGASVTQVLRGDNVLRGFDDDMRDGLCRRAARGGRSTCGTGIVPHRIEKTETGLRCAS